MRGYILTDPAIADLEDIAERYLQVRPESVEILVAEIKKKLRFIGRHPRIGTDSGHLLESLRRVVARDYLIFYQHLSGRAVVCRTLHGGRDIDAAFFDGSNP